MPWNVRSLSKWSLSCCWVSGGYVEVCPGDALACEGEHAEAVFREPADCVLYVRGQRVRAAELQHSLGGALGEHVRGCVPGVAHDDAHALQRGLEVPDAQHEERPREARVERLQLDGLAGLADAALLGEAGSGEEHLPEVRWRVCVWLRGLFVLRGQRGVREAEELALHGVAQQLALDRGERVVRGEVLQEQLLRLGGLRLGPEACLPLAQLDQRLGPGLLRAEVDRVQLHFVYRERAGLVEENSLHAARRVYQSALQRHDALGLQPALRVLDADRERQRQARRHHREHDVHARQDDLPG